MYADVLAAKENPCALLGTFDDDQDDGGSSDDGSDESLSMATMVIQVATAAVAVRYKLHPYSTIYI